MYWRPDNVPCKLPLSDKDCARAIHVSTPEDVSAAIAGLGRDAMMAESRGDHVDVAAARQRIVALREVVTT